MLRARKYWFALCFRVLSNQYVDRSAYANVFKFNKENKRFERAKVNSWCFHWFPVAMLESFRRAPTWRLRIIFSETFCRITHTSPKLWHVYLLIFYDISISWLNILNGKRFYFSRAWWENHQWINMASAVNFKKKHKTWVARNLSPQYGHVILMGEYLVLTSEN